MFWDEGGTNCNSFVLGSLLNNDQNQEFSPSLLEDVTDRLNQLQLGFQEVVPQQLPFQS